MQNNITFNITDSQVTIVNESARPFPYRAIKSSDGVLHIFYTKDAYNEYVEELKEQR